MGLGGVKHDWDSRLVGQTATEDDGWGGGTTGDGRGALLW